MPRWFSHSYKNNEKSSEAITSMKQVHKTGMQELKKEMEDKRRGWDMNYWSLGRK